MIYFKAFRGYGDDFVSVRNDELERAIYAQITGKLFIGSGGTFDGNKIQMIKPDYHKSMGWNYEYKLTAEDWGEVNVRVGNLEPKILEAEDRVRYFIQTKQENLIGTGAALPKENLPRGDMLKQISDLANSKKIS